MAGLFWFAVVLGVIWLLLTPVFWVIVGLYVVWLIWQRTPHRRATQPARDEARRIRNEERAARMAATKKVERERQLAAQRWSNATKASQLSATTDRVASREFEGKIDLACRIAEDYRQVGWQAPWKEQENAARAANAAARQAESYLSELRAEARTSEQVSQIRYVEALIRKAESDAKTFQDYADD